MTKTKAQLRAEAVERLRKLPPMDTTGNQFVNAMTGPMPFMTAQDVNAALVYLLTDDCGPCYSCAKLAELRAENSALREMAAEKDDTITVLKAENAEVEREVDRLTRENISLARDLGECMAERDGLKRENAKLSDDEFYLRCTLVDMEGNVIS